MGISLHTCAYGRAAAALLHARVAAAKAGDPLRPVTIVVPTNSVGVSVRRLLASGELGPLGPTGAGVVGLTLLTVFRLAELLGAPRLAAAGRRPVSTPVVAAAVRRVLGHDPGMFAEVRGHPATEESLVRAHRELSSVPPAALDRIAAASRRAADVVRIHREVRGQLAPDWYDEADLMEAARAAATARSPILADLGTIVVHLPQDLSRQAAALLVALAATCPVEVVAGRAGHPDADADVDRALRRLGLDPAQATGAPVAMPTATAIVSVSDADEEVRTALGRILDAVRAGTPLERVALLYPSEQPYARIVHEHLTAAGIPYNGLAVRPLADRLLGRWLLDVLALPRHGYRREDVMGVVASMPATATGGERVPAAAWERIGRAAGVVRGRDDWTRKLRQAAAGWRSEADAEAAGPNGREWLAERRRRDAETADQLAAFADELFGALDAGAALRSWRALAGWARDLVARYVGAEHQREHWPEVERSAAERVDAALDRFEALDAVEPATDLDVFRRSLELHLDDDLGRVGTLGEGLLVGTPAHALGVDLEVVVVLGMAEGVFPAVPREDSLLPDAERRTIEDDLRPRSAQTGTQHRHLLAALASSAGGRILLHPRGDLRRSAERVPSRWLLDSVEVLRGDGLRALPASAVPWFEQVASFASRVARASFPATRQEYALRDLADQRRAGGRLADHPLVSGDEALRRGVDLVLARRGPEFTRFDGNLGQARDLVGSPADPGAVVSATQLEAYMRCPHAYLMQYVLRVEPVERPEELIEIGALERGNLLHLAFEEWLREQLDAGLPASHEQWPEPARQRLVAIVERWCDDFAARGLTGHERLWRRDRHRILHDVARFLDEDDRRRRADGATPLAAEYPFGLPGAESGPVEIDLGDGRSVRIRGKVDRIDALAAGGLLVTDYKTGSTSRYDGIGDDDPDDGGTKLQLPIYALAARARAGDPSLPVVAEYWFASTRGGFEHRRLAVDDAKLDRLRAVLRVAVDGIGAGHFPQRPEPPSWLPYNPCWHCDPDDLGTSDRYRRWEELRLAADLRDYVAIVERDVLEMAS